MRLGQWHARHWYILLTKVYSYYLYMHYNKYSISLTAAAYLQHYT